MPKLITQAPRYSVAIIAQVAKLPRPVAEHRFHAVRKWRFDFAWVAERIALEVEGGVWTQGRHTRGSGAKKDMEKYNHAASEGWLVFRTTPDAVYSHTMLGLLARAWAMRAAEKPSVREGQTDKQFKTVRHPEWQAFVDDLAAKVSRKASA